MAGTFSKVEFPVDEKKYEDAVGRAMEDIGKDEEILAFLRENGVPEEEVRRNAIRLSWICGKNRICASCPGLDRCPLTPPGYRPVPSYSQGTIFLDLAPCGKKSVRRKAENARRNCLYSDLPRRNRSMTLSGLIAKASAQSSLAWIKALDEARKWEESPQKGLFVQGKSASGKSLLLSALFNDLAGKGRLTAYFDVPLTAREVRSSTSYSTKTEAMDRINEAARGAQVVVLDGLGEESVVNAWRDDFLVPLLNRCLRDDVLLLAGSRYGPDELAVIYQKNIYQDLDEGKGQMIAERIRSLTRLIEL